MNQLDLKQTSIALSKKMLDKTFNNFSENPFKHLFIDNFFETNFANRLLENFPELDSELWERTNDQAIEVKMRSKWTSEFDIPEKIVDAIRIMNSALFLQSLSNALGIPKLIPDPYFSGGGLNVTCGGFRCSC